MTPQEIFDTVYKHLVTQGKRSHEDGYCKYRNPEGLKCAVGCLIPDDMYNPEFDDTEVNGDTYLGAILDQYDMPDWMYAHKNLLTSLQMVHDAIDAWDETGLSPYGHTEMRSLASHYKLEYAKP